MTLFDKQKPGNVTKSPVSGSQSKPETVSLNTSTTTTTTTTTSSTILPTTTTLPESQITFAKPTRTTTKPFKNRPLWGYGNKKSSTTTTSTTTTPSPTITTRKSLIITKKPNIQEVNLPKPNNSSLLSEGTSQKCEIHLN